MNLLFQDIEDIKSAAGWIYSSMDFDALLPDIESATEDLIRVVGSDVYDRVAEYHQSLIEPVSETDDDEDTQSDSELSAEAELNAELLRLMRCPIALNALLSYMQSADISHETDGRKVKIDKDSESIPWEWQIEKDNAAMRNKAARATDRLIRYMDENIDDIDEWADSAQRADIRSLFVPDAATFDRIAPIDESRLFFIRVLPFIRRADAAIRERVPSYATIKAHLVADTLTTPEQAIVNIAREIVVYDTMSLAIRRLSVLVMPDAVVQTFHSDSQTLKAGQVPSEESIKLAVESWKKDKEDAERRLEILQARQAGKTETMRSVDYSGEKFFTV